MTQIKHCLSYTVDSEAVPNSAKPTSYVCPLVINSTEGLQVKEILFRKIPQSPCEGETQVGQPASLSPRARGSVYKGEWLLDPVCEAQLSH